MTLPLRCRVGDQRDEAAYDVLMSQNLIECTMTTNESSEDRRLLLLIDQLPAKWGGK
jgi:hypothetical protein